MIKSVMRPGVRCAHIFRMKRAAMAWLGLFVLAFLNGAFREFVLKAGMGLSDLFAHQLSCLTGVVLWTAFVFLIWERLQIKSVRQAALVGFYWFSATLIFETFVLNRNLSWAEVRHTYDVMAGEFWGLVLLWIGLLPVVVFFVKKRSHVSR